MPKKSRTRKPKERPTTPVKGRRPWWQQIAIILVILLAALVFLFTGWDPLGLFQPTGWETYFTNPGGGSNPIQPTLVSYINNANQSIHIAAFEFNLTPIAEALIAAQRRGVEVKWVTDDEHGLGADREKGHGQFALLQRAGIPVRTDNRPDLMHDKFIIFDNRVVWTGSTNLTNNGIGRNNNNVIVLKSPEIAAIFEREFAEMWAGQFGPSSPSTVAQQQANVKGTPIQVLFGPEDNVADVLVSLLQGARQSIRFMAFSFTHDRMGGAVLSRSRAGVDVRGIFETNGSQTQYSELPILFCAGVPVRQDGNSGMLHHKVVVIDESTVITGSFNFSNNADRRNDENVVIVKNSDIAKKYLQEFETLWAQARQPVRDKMKCR